MCGNTAPEKRENKSYEHRAGPRLSGQCSSCNRDTLSALSRIHRKILSLGGLDHKPCPEKAEMSGSLELTGYPICPMVNSRPIRYPILSSGEEGKKEEKKKKGEKKGVGGVK